MPPPPPPFAAPELPLIVLLVRVSVPPLKIPPPLADFPLEIVRPEMFTTLPELILKMRKSGVPLAVLRITVNRLAPGPVIVRLLSNSNSPDVNVMGLARPAAKVIVPPSQAWKIVSRKDPAPLSLLFV